MVIFRYFLSSHGTETEHGLGPAGLDTRPSNRLIGLPGQAPDGPGGRGGRGSAGAHWEVDDDTDPDGPYEGVSQRSGIRVVDVVELCSTLGMSVVAGSLIAVAGTLLVGSFSTYWFQQKGRPRQGRPRQGRPRQGRPEGRNREQQQKKKQTLGHRQADTGGRHVPTPADRLIGAQEP